MPVTTGCTPESWYERQLVGVISYNYVDQGRQQTEIGYWLDQDFQGHGLMTAACRVMVDYGFSYLHLARIEIRCAVANAKSRAIPERLGFDIEGLAPQLDWLSDHYIDTVVYSMSATNWAAKEGA